MKKTFPANIDGQIFYIDEDAFALLSNYLDQLHQTFTGAEGVEIVSDIESRIREHFSERIDRGARVIVLADVNDVITTMGRPEEISGNEEPSHSQVPPCPDEEKGYKSNQAPFLSFNLPGRKRLYRNMDNKVFGGVFGGLAVYLNWNANIMRLLYIALTCFTYFWPLTILYLIAWMIIPAAETPKQILEMKGDPVNVDTVGKAVKASAVTPPPYRESSDGGFFSTFFGIIGKCLMGFLGFIAVTIAFVCLVAFFAIIAGMIALASFSSTAILAGMDLYPLEGGWIGMWAILCALLLAVIVAGAISWGAFAIIFRSRGVPRSAVWATIILSAMLLIATIVLFAASCAA